MAPIATPPRRRSAIGNARVMSGQTSTIWMHTGISSTVPMSIKLLRAGAFQKQSRANALRRRPRIDVAEIAVHKTMVDSRAKRTDRLAEKKSSKNSLTFPQSVASKALGATNLRLSCNPGTVIESGQLDICAIVGRIFPGPASNRFLSTEFRQD